MSTKLRRLKFAFGECVIIVYVYKLWRVSARTSLDKNWFWKIQWIFQVGTDQAIAYILCYSLSISVLVVSYDGYLVHMNTQALLK